MSIEEAPCEWTVCETVDTELIEPPIESSCKSALKLSAPISAYETDANGKNHASKTIEE